MFFPFAVPPHQILVYDASGRDVAGSVGPLLEDNNLVLTCEVRGGEFDDFKVSQLFPWIKFLWFETFRSKIKLEKSVYPEMKIDGSIYVGIIEKSYFS